VIRGDLLAHPPTAERFRREALLVARLRHPNIVTVYDYDEAEGVGAYLVMELLEGHSLRMELAGRERLGVGEALALMAPVCEAVAAAHRAGVIHRDLKPDNVFLERRDGAAAALSAKVLDFGIAKLSEGSLFGGEALTVGGAVIGTPAYLSPEQCRGDVADARSDVYALGCVLYEMLTGRPPFVCPSVASVVYDHVRRPARPPSELVSGISPALDEALLRALAKAPDERYQTVEAFARALSMAGDGAASVTAPPGAITAEGRANTGPLETARVSGTLPSNNLPRAMTHFIGRERQIVDVLERLARSPLVSLVGPGGIGKSRLGLEVAYGALEPYPDGVWLVELASLSHPSLVARTVADAVGVLGEPGRDTVDSLREWLRDRRVLLLLDNCEHLVDGCARLAEQLLSSCPRLRVLATTREALGVAGEAVWPVPTLSVPDAAMPDDEVLACEAVRMFVDRAALSNPGFAVTGSAIPALAALCRRLEGIPLALELAAARVKVLSIEQILAKLADPFGILAGGSRTAPSRQQTLRATLDWSHELLTEEERALLRRLAIFAGGCTLEAAEAVAGGNGEYDGSSLRRSDVLDLLSRLVDKSLVIAQDRGREVRFGMLETIREYALEHLRASGELGETARRHADVFMALVGSARAEFNTPDGAQWLARLEVEHDNLRAALGWLLKHDAENGVRLAIALPDLWVYHGHFTEARRWLKAAVERAASAPTPLRVKALQGAGELAFRQGDLAEARSHLEESMRLSREMGEARAIAWSAYHLALLVFQQGDAQTSRTYFEESLARARDMRELRLIGTVLNSLGELARYEGDWATARPLYEQSLATHRQSGDVAQTSMTLCNLGAVRCEEGDLEGALSAYRESLACAHRFGNNHDVSIALDGVGAVATKRGDWPRAARLAGAAEALREEIGCELEVADRAFRDRYVAEVGGKLGDEQIEAALAEGRAMGPERAILYALSTLEEEPSL
jgi:serine/threonine-protein kinase PknK